MSERLFVDDKGQRVDGAIEFAISEIIGKNWVKAHNLTRDDRGLFPVECKVGGVEFSAREIAEAIHKGLERSFKDEVISEARKLIDGALKLEVLRQFGEQVMDMVSSADKLAGTLAEAEARGLHDLKAKDVQWVVEDDGDLGVLIRGKLYTLYKGESMCTSGEKKVRPVRKREFGESCVSPWKGDPDPLLFQEGDWVVIPGNSSEEVAP